VPQLPKLDRRGWPRNQTVVNRANNPTPRPRKLRKRKRPHLLKTSVLKVIPGTRGLWSVLARRLGCAVSTAQKSLSQEGWEWVREAFEQEKLTAKDKCAETVFNIALYGLSDDSRLNAAKFILEKTHPEFQSQTRVTVEGGDKPIKHAHVTFNLPPEVLNASVDDKIKLLEMLDEVNPPEPVR